MEKSKLSAFEKSVYLFSLAILVGIIVIGAIAMINDMRLSNEIGGEGIITLLLTGIGIFIASAVFIPNIAIKRTVENYMECEREKNEEEIMAKVNASIILLHDELSEFKSNLLKKIEEDELFISDNHADLLAVEAHECRMNAFFLSVVDRNENPTALTWGLGWALKGAYKYADLFIQKQFTERYDLLVLDLRFLVTKISAKIIEDIKYGKDNNYLNHEQTDIRSRYIHYFKLIAKIRKINRHKIFSKLDTVNKEFVTRQYKTLKELIMDSNLNRVLAYYVKYIDEDYLEAMREDNLLIEENMRDIIDTYCTMFQQFSYDDDIKVNNLEKLFFDV
jgi:predicted DNA-binding protein